MSVKYECRGGTISTTSSINAGGLGFRPRQNSTSLGGNRETPASDDISSRLKRDLDDGSDVMVSEGDAPLDPVARDKALLLAPIFSLYSGFDVSADVDTSGGAIVIAHDRSTVRRLVLYIGPGGTRARIKRVQRSGVVDERSLGDNPAPGAQDFAWLAGDL